MTSEAPQDVAALLREVAEAARTESGFWYVADTFRVVIDDDDDQVFSDADAEFWAAASPDVVLGLLDQNDRLRSALREIVDAEDRLNAAWQDTSRGFFVEQVEDHDHARRNAIAAARALLSQRGSGAEEAARNE